MRNQPYYWLLFMSVQLNPMTSVGSSQYDLHNSIEMRDNSIMAYIVSTPPPRIIHVPKRPAKYRQMIYDSAANIHLRQQSMKLLLFYADQANGFSPALALIHRETGIAPNKVSEIRQRLVKRGLLFYNNQEHAIYIAWDRIQAFAILDKPILISRGKSTFSPFDPYAYNEKPKKRIKYIKQRRLVPIPWTKDQERQFKVLQEMSPEMYREYLFLGK